MFLQFILLTLIICAPLQAIEYVYPVAATQRDDQLKIYVNYQSSNENGRELLLWEWDPITKVAAPAIIPAYMPTSVKVLPTGISFIDKGKIFVKSFNKRSPKSILFYEPVDDIVSINWIANEQGGRESFYFTGKQGDHYGIFHGTTRGNLYPLVHGDQNDYLYPQKVGNTLFCIRRTGDQYMLMSCDYPTILLEQSAEDAGTSYHEQVDAMLKQTRSQMMPLVSEDQMHELLPLPPHGAFLDMSAREGFMVSHPTDIAYDQAWVQFGYWHLSLGEDGRWNKEQLFEFTLPRSLIMDEPAQPLGDSHYIPDALYESLMPLLPCHMQGVIYYVDAGREAKVGAEPAVTMYHYDLKSRSRYPIAATQISNETLSFGPLRVNEFLFYGGRIRSEDLGTGNSKPAAWINQEGLLCLDLPTVVDSAMDLAQLQRLLVPST